MGRKASSNSARGSVPRSAGNGAGPGFVMPLRDIGRGDLARVGGKAAQLGALARIDGVRVPDGFCITTAAFDRILAEAPATVALLGRLSRVAPDDLATIRSLASAIRATIETAPVARGIEAAIVDGLARFDARTAFAVRSSATAEDLQDASFAGQLDSYLGIVGTDAVLRHVRRCWASPFTERAIAYRLRNGLGGQRVRMAVVVQAMVAARAAGVLFTADPVDGNRRVATVEACHGLGEGLVAGTAHADAWKVRDGAIVARTLVRKTHALEAAPAGGTRERALDPERAAAPALADAEVLALVGLGRRIEAHFGHPQDIEWCLDGDGLHVVQSRPITTLFPIPEADDDGPHVYLSVGHQQMYTAPLRPLALSIRKLSNAGMREAGGRQFVDVARQLSTAGGRAGLLGLIGKGDPLTGDALRTLIARDFVPLQPEAPRGGGDATPPPAGAPPAEPGPGLVDALVAEAEASLAASRRGIHGKSGLPLLAFIAQDMEEMGSTVLFNPRVRQALMAGIDASAWLNEHLHEWLGETNVADILTRSAPGNITSEMGLAMLDVADAIRPHGQVVDFLERVEADDFLDALAPLPGGAAVRDAIRAWLARYGMRCPGEIDITCPRWHERPSLLLPTLLAHVRHAEAGAAARRFAEGRRDARDKEADVLQRLRALPDGARKAGETKRMIDRLHRFIGYREYPKYAMICRFDVYRQALLAEAGRLVRAGVLRERDDLYYLRLEELPDVVRTGTADHAAIDLRRRQFEAFRRLTPPRVMTSEGESVAGAYRRDDLPDGALAGVAVSAGTVEGRARVVHDMARTDIEPGDILVTACTDPGWTPLFAGIAGLVTEIGGTTSHGAVIAREYGLPAVVSVPDATRLIHDGQRVRVHGTEGYVELL